MIGGYAKNDFSLVKTLAENSSAALTGWLPLVQS
jgi:hypothetical protein